MCFKNKMNKYFILTAMIFSLFAGCGYYSFKGALPSYLKSVAIPIFVDRTAYPGIQELVTDSVIESFVTDNTLKVVDESKADIILTGTIQSVNQRAAAVKSGETVSEYQIYVNVKVVCEDVKMSKKLYEKVFSQYGLMSNTGGQDEKDAAINSAVELITEDIVNTTLGGW